MPDKVDKPDVLLSPMRVGLYASYAVSVLTIGSFVFAMTAVPPSGPYCVGNCMEYPFRDILSYYPRDYIWMYLAGFQLCALMVFFVANYFAAPVEKKIYSFISVVFGLMAVIVLLGDYFVQFAVVPMSLMRGETEGIALLTQYNDHGIFIALEELGYILMSLAFLFLVPVFSTKNLLQRAIRWTLPVPFAACVIAFIFYSIQYGLDRSYRFEVVAITVNWLVTVVIGILMAVFFRRGMNRAA